MKRLHVHVSVDNLADSIKFYSGMFAAGPSVVKTDYAKWMLDDPRVSPSRHIGNLRTLQPSKEVTSISERCLKKSVVKLRPGSTY
jgi:hypothetical protein